MDELHSMIKSKTKVHTFENFILTFQKLIYKKYNNKPPENIKNTFDTIIKSNYNIQSILNKSKYPKQVHDNDIKKIINYIKK